MSTAQHNENENQCLRCTFNISFICFAQYDYSHNQFESEPLWRGILLKVPMKYKITIPNLSWDIAVFSVGQNACALKI